MKPIHCVALIALLAACGAPAKSAQSPAPTPAPDPAGGTTTPMAPSVTTAPGDKDAPSAPSAPKADRPMGASPGVIGGVSDGSATSRATTTSPTIDASSGPGGPSAGPSTGPRLEDIKTEKTTATGGTYQVRVLSANSLAPDEVGKSVNAAASKTDACYSQALKKKVSPGAVTYELSVNAQGAAGAVKQTSDTVKDAALSKCLETTLKGISWPKPTDKTGGKTTIEFSIAK